MAGHKSVSEWEELFKSVDKDNSGTIDREEMKQLLKKGNSNLTESQLDDVFTFFDGPGGDKKISKDEFIKGLKDIETYIRGLEACYKQFDSDKSGYLDKNELKKILDESGQKFTDAEVNEILRQADSSGDGKISFEEFISAFT